MARGSWQKFQHHGFLSIFRCSILNLMIFTAVVSKHAKPETPTPINNPQIIPTVKAYRVMLPSSGLSEKRLVTNSGEIVAINAPNAPPSKEASSEPIKISKKYPDAVFTNPSCRFCFSTSSINNELPLRFVLSSRFFNYCVLPNFFSSSR